ncbi:hypothetical protein PHLGIDRAFT_129842 [Phlebiopsis gigantea 11061_1 CR5-6]|uniref:Uracil-DNA glycosylase-like domain-containing protein n=1 Tax=Phlebiopsis gigantea (strain 11061_1 CR5-6) TaxID=745531 RepID=A0A0C3S666_PHLG1|nr:hypothetical protein PHLGIDRAFT_129842 [Phlebiopsis gigantea 11061_1 CR5-6]
MMTSCLASLPPAPRRKSRKKPRRPYAPPKVYEHLHMLPDYLAMDMDVVFCGINPGCTSANTGHHYAHSTNHFWLCLHESGLTERLLSPSDDWTLPSRYNYGLTNLVDRPSAEQSELSRHEMRQGTPTLLEKIAKYRPRIVCFLSKTIWEVFRQETSCLHLKALEDQPSTPKDKHYLRSTSPTKPVRSRFFPFPQDSTGNTEDDSAAQAAGSQPAARPHSYKFVWGPQPFKVVHDVSDESTVCETLFYVVPSPSARVVRYQWWHKVEFFADLRAYISKSKADEVDTSTMTVITGQT